MNFEDYQHLLIQDESGLVTITIDRPQAMNALNKAVFTELNEVLNQLNIYQALKGVILTGAGSKAFVAGADITEFAGIEQGTAKSFLQLGNDVMNRIESFRRPWIAAVNGYALGGGCELAMACHLRIASHHAKFGLPEITLGILPGYGGTQRLPRIIGKAKAFELTLTGEMIDADLALKLGLINHMTPPDELLAKSKEIILKIASKAPLSISRIIDAINFSSGHALNEGISFEGDAFTWLADRNDFKEGVRAFVEKRKPNFKGE